jgi:hypothetical protein
MPDVHETILQVLEPYVSRPIASTYVRATAITLRKTSDRLEYGDLGALEMGLREMLQPVASRQLIDETILEIRERLRV